MDYGHACRQTTIFRITEGLPVIWDSFPKEIRALSVGQTGSAKRKRHGKSRRRLPLLRKGPCYAETHDVIAVVGRITFSGGRPQQPRREHQRDQLRHRSGEDSIADRASRKSRSV
jgi:hypothetical protein